MTKVRKLQKISVLAALIASVLVFVLALGYATSVYDVYYYGPESRFYVEGAEIFDLIQPFNKALLGFGALMLVMVVAMCATLTRSRRLYYLSNYLTSGVFAAFSAFVGVITVVKSVGFVEKYSHIDFVKYAEYAERFGTAYNEDSTSLVLGIPVGICAVAAAAVVTANVLIKASDMKKERALREGNADE